MLLFIYERVLLPCEQGEIVLVVPNWFLISMKYLQEAREYYSNTRNVFASDVTWNVSEMKLGKKKKDKTDDYISLHKRNFHVG